MAEITRVRFRRKLAASSTSLSSLIINPNQKSNQCQKGSGYGGIMPYHSPSKLFIETVFLGFKHKTLNTNIATKDVTILVLRQKYVTILVLRQKYVTILKL
jgi:hypothetical protein